MHFEEDLLPSNQVLALKMQKARRNLSATLDVNRMYRLRYGCQCFGGQ